MALVTDEEWAKYKADFDKNYNEYEDKMRRSFYEKAKAKIEAHNKKFESGEVTWKMGINHLADLSEEEFAKRCGSKPPK